jgi:hypothetical protein
MKADYGVQKAASKVRALELAYRTSLLTYGIIESSFRSPSTKQENPSRAGKDTLIIADRSEDRGRIVSGRQEVAFVPMYLPLLSLVSVFVHYCVTV